MITLLAKFFIKKDGRDERRQYGTLCSIVGIMLNVLLFAGKFFAGLISGSIAVMADAFNNLSDAGSSFITLAGFRLAGKKPDPQHPFGHGRFEYVSGLIVSIMILMMGFELGKSSFSKILHPESMESGILFMVILCVSIAVKCYMFFYNSRIGKKVGSPAMLATSMDSLSDCVATTVVLVAMIIYKVFNFNADGISGLFVAAFIIYSGIGAAKDTISPLLGQPPEEEFVEQITGIVMKYDKVIGMHDLVVHDYGPGRCLISLHAEVPGNEDIFELHDMIDNIENELKTELGCEAVIHMDPIETDNEVVMTYKSKVADLVKKIDESINIHDFRMVSGTSHTNLVFDVVIPYSVKMSEEEVKERISQDIKKLDDSFYAVISVDREYVK